MNGFVQFKREAVKFIEWVQFSDEGLFLAWLYLMIGGVVGLVEAVLHAF